MLADRTSAELVRWIAYLEIEEERSYNRQVNALTYIANQLFRKEE